MVTTPDLPPVRYGRPPPYHTPRILRRHPHPSDQSNDQAAIDELIAGGQGRSPSSIWDITTVSAWAAAIAVFLCAAAIVVVEMPVFVGALAIGLGGLIAIFRKRRP